MVKGIPLTVTWPNEGFLIVESLEGNTGSNYNIKYKYNDRDLDTVVA